MYNFFFVRKVLVDGASLSVSGHFLYLAGLLGQQE
jgi:hypothetical protein